MRSLSSGHVADRLGRRRFGRPFRASGSGAEAWRPLPPGLYAGPTSKEQAMASRPSEKKPDPASSANALGPLPEWNLADLYPGRDSPELKRDLARTEAEAGAFRER